jgi:uncharacterized membrane protein YwaF
MDSSFIFSREHLMILLAVVVYLYFVPRLTKNLLPYSYLIEKIICSLMAFDILMNQLALVSTQQYNVYSSLPIDLGSFTVYLCIFILIFRQYHLFNIFFSWSFVTAIGDLVFFRDFGDVLPDFLSFLYVMSKFLIIYASVYMYEVRKFRVNSDSIKENLIMCFIYFSFIILINAFTPSQYYYSFSNNNLLSIVVFVILTTAIYIPHLLPYKDDYAKFLKKRSK